jgi:hypothetical protein
VDKWERLSIEQREDGIGLSLSLLVGLSLSLLVGLSLSLLEISAPFLYRYYLYIKI